jgi:hypothetical protein
VDQQFITGPHAAQTPQATYDAFALSRGAGRRLSGNIYIRAKEDDGLQQQRYDYRGWLEK